MIPESEMESLQEEARAWRVRFYVATSVLTLVVLFWIVLGLGGTVANDAVTACGSACGAGRMKSARRSACECDARTIVEGR